MAGSKGDVIVGKNADFSQAGAPNATSGEANGLITNGQIWIGTTALNVGGSHINVGTLTSPDGSITFGYSSPNITAQVSSPTYKITTYLVDGTWTKDSRSQIVEFYVTGGGGGGGSGRCGASGAAGGGGGGAGGDTVYQKTLASLLNASPYTITIGTGGTGGIAINAVNTNGNNGNAGNDTTVGSIILASGGRRGGQGTTTNSTTASSFVYSFGTTQTLVAGSIGTATNGTVGAPQVYAFSTGGGGGCGYTAATPRTGLAGGSNTDPNGTVIIAGGLGGANTGATAGNGNSPGVQSLFILGGTGGGAGGHDGVVTAGTGGNGAQPGGGGGGGAGNLSSNPSGAGGNGGNGRVIIIEYF